MDINFLGITINIISFLVGIFCGFWILKWFLEGITKNKITYDLQHLLLLEIYGVLSAIFILLFGCTFILLFKYY